MKQEKAFSIEKRERLSLTISGPTNRKIPSLWGRRRGGGERERGGEVAGTRGVGGEGWRVGGTGLGLDEVVNVGHSVPVLAKKSI